MKTVELDMRRMELIRDIMDTDSIEVLDKVKRAFKRKPMALCLAFLIRSYLYILLLDNYFCKISNIPLNARLFKS